VIPLTLSAHEQVTPHQANQLLIEAQLGSKPDVEPTIAVTKNGEGVFRSIRLDASCHSLKRFFSHG